MSKHAQSESEFVELYPNEKGRHITLSTFSQPSFVYSDQSAPFHLDSAPDTLCMQSVREFSSTQCRPESSWPGVSLLLKILLPFFFRWLGK